jgi:hypothetical protein
MRIEPLTTESFASLDYRVMSCAYASQNQIGRLADERIYEASLAHQLEKLGLSWRRQVPIHVEHKTFHKNQRLARKWGQEYIVPSFSCPYFLAYETD